MSEVLSTEWFRCPQCDGACESWGAAWTSNGIRIDVSCGQCDAEAHIYPFEEDKERGSDG